MKKLRYQDFVDELSKGNKFGVFVDDTGSPGLSTLSPKLHASRKSWVAVVVPPSQMPEVLAQIPGAVGELRKITGATEFHFTDIYQGRKEFEDIDLAIRLRIFEFMAFIFQTYNFPVFVQTFDFESWNLVKDKALFPEVAGPFNLAKPEDAALLFLLMRLKWFLQKESGIARVFVDEGYKKAGIAMHLPAFRSVFADGLVCFASSSSILPLQLADFAAFALNREQLILSKKNLNDRDVQLVKLLEPLARAFQNIPMANIRLRRTGETWEPEP
jgi:hypothetical protein